MFTVSDEVLALRIRVIKDPSDQGNSVVYKAANIRGNKWFWLGISCEKNKAFLVMLPVSGLILGRRQKCIGCQCFPGCANSKVQ